MSLERKDVRFKLDAEWHAVLTSAAKGDIGEWVERLVMRELKQQVDDALSLADAAERAGVAGNFRDSRGTKGTDRGTLT